MSLQKHYNIDVSANLWHCFLGVQKAASISGPHQGQ